MIEFGEPALLLLALPVLAWLIPALRGAARGVGAGGALRHPQALAGGAAMPAPQRLPAWLRTVAFLLIVVALAQPRQAGEWIEPPPEGRDLALVLDVSLTMRLADFAAGGREVSRIAVLKQVLGDFVAARHADRFALLVFGSEVALLTPPTFDRDHVVAQLQRLQPGMAGDGTALGDAIGLALRQLRQQRLRPAVILVSDGEPSNAGAMTPAEAVAVARQIGVAVHTLQVGAGPRSAQGTTAGTDAAAAQDAQPGLEDIARLTGGRHWSMRSTDDAVAVIRAIDALEPVLARPASERHYREWYPLPLALAVCCLWLAQLVTIRRQGFA